MRKIILRCDYALGDVVMLTAAVRDLHRCYPGQYITDVRTFYPDLWDNNPFITRLSEADPDVEEIRCTYPLIDRAGVAGCHCLNGFVEFLNDRLGLKIRLTALRGDIHLSELERRWASQVHELTGEATPFWIVVAGGKHDATVKWWHTSRYQQVVDYFKGRIQFVQVGNAGDHHPRLNGVIDLRGQTSVRELVRLVHHSQGVLCPITGLMHLAAAVPCRGSRGAQRPCVVVAGGREPPHWEAYPGHQYVHTVGALACCGSDGCWQDRTVRLRDGAKQDRPGALCASVKDGLPECMALICPEAVAQRVEFYLQGGAAKPLTERQLAQAEKGIKATATNPFDNQPLSIHSAGLACDRFLNSIPGYPGGFAGRGIVICGGGARYFTNSWVCINMLRRLDCRLPIELWHLGRGELNARMRALVEPLGVTCVDAQSIRKHHPARRLNGWELKCYAILHSRFREVLLLDADNVPVVDPEFLFETPQFTRTGALFWPDFHGRGHNIQARLIWRSCGLREPKEKEFETGQIMVDKQRCWKALNLCLWMNEHSDFYYRYVHGDKETFHLAFRKARKSYSLVPFAIHPLKGGTMCQHDFTGRRVFQHRNMDKWDLLLCNRRIPDFWREEDCLRDVITLRGLWDGSVNARKPNHSRPKLRAARSITLEAVMISCPERSEVREQTLHDLAKTDWGDWELHIEVDPQTEGNPQERQTACAFRALSKALRRSADYVLFLEDDLSFNLWLRHNLMNWPPLLSGFVSLAGLYNPGLREEGCSVPTRSRFVAPGSIFGSQAFLLSKEAVRFIVRNWNRVQGMQDIRISRLAGRLRTPICYHAPSLVQHRSGPSTWGGRPHQAFDFDETWRR